MKKAAFRKLEPRSSLRRARLNPFAPSRAWRVLEDSDSLSTALLPRLKISLTSLSLHWTNENEDEDCEFYLPLCKHQRTRTQSCSIFYR